jgi:hypothetical protein
VCALLLLAVGVCCGLVPANPAPAAAAGPAASEWRAPDSSGREREDLASREPVWSGSAHTESSAGAPAWSFRRTQAPSGAGPLGLLAVAARDGLIATGDRDGVQVSVDGSAYRRVVRSGPVADLVFGPNGSLFVSAADGLQEWTPDGRSLQRSPGAGEVARFATRLRVANGTFALATAGGLFLSSDGRSWSPRVGVIANAPVTGLALRALPGESSPRVEVLAVAGDFPWRLVVRTTPNGPEVESSERISVPGRPAGTRAVDVAFADGRAEVVVAYPSLLAARSDAGHWRTIRPVLPPGSAIRRVEHGMNRVWLLTDRGLLAAEDLGAPFRRCESPAGTTPAAALAIDANRLLVASEAGLLEGRVVRSRIAKGPPHGAARPFAPSPARAVEPDIHAVHAAALRYLELGPERVRQLRKGVDRRGWLPFMSLRFDYAADRDRREDWDQSFVSGETRRLYDYSRNRARDYGAVVQLSWDLGDTLYNADAVDLSREARQRIALRDDALDEINQLYFERRRVLFTLDALSPESDVLEAERLRLRAQELAAGLDGWTGGWFSSAAAARASR